MNVQGLEDLQTKLANLIHGLKSSEVEPNGRMAGHIIPSAPTGWGQGAPIMNGAGGGGSGGWESPGAAGWSV